MRGTGPGIQKGEAGVKKVGMTERFTKREKKGEGGRIRLRKETDQEFPTGFSFPSAFT